MPDLRLFLPKRLPVPLIAAAVLLVVFTWVPLATILRYTQLRHSEPRIQLFQGMGTQPRLNAQDASPIFADGRAMRLPPRGTVSRDSGVGQDLLTQGYRVVSGDGQPAAQFLTGFPEELEVDSFFLARGQEKFDTFCFPCHGKAGYGDGPVNLRAMRLTLGDPTLSYGTAWVASANLQNVYADGESAGKLQFGAELYPNGQLFNVITHGKGNMGAYGHAIDVEDRWAIVAYVRALQLSQHPNEARAAMDAARLLDVQTATK